MGERRAFNIGLSMAGAVSGGAYSAGVFDFLMEALSEWHKAKERGGHVPDHDVYISALSGTSAGGITAAMGVAALAAGVRNIELPPLDPRNTAPVRRTLPELYDIWVKKVRLFRPHGPAGKSADEGPALLDTGDAKPLAAPPSLLNSDVLTRIAREALLAVRPTGVTYPFFTNPTHLFLTHTNLDGVPYPIEFARDGYSMMLHEGRTHFAVKGLGSAPFPKECTWLAKWGDTGIDLDISKLGDAIAPQKPGDPLHEPFEALAQSALTTSAFPFGFSGRCIAIDRNKLHNAAMPFDPGNFPDELSRREKAAQPFYRAETHAHFVCIDGGAMNNEPFEVVRWTIKSGNEQQNVRNSKTADRAVILIAPFPPEANYDIAKLTANRPVGLGFIGRALVPALINQARFKASDLIAASDPNVYSRFLISPSRENATPALASSKLYAFAGFLDEAFREHDFQLGRRNCQWFLRQHFTLSRANPLFGGPANAEGRFKAVEDREHPHPDDEWPVIPLVGSAAQEVPLLAWPVMSRDNLRVLRKTLLTRLDLLSASFTSQIFDGYPGLRSAAALAWWRHRRKILRKMVQYVETQLGSQIEPRPAPRLIHWLRGLWRQGAWYMLLAGLAALIFIVYDLVFNWQ